MKNLLLTCLLIAGLATSAQEKRERISKPGQATYTSDQRVALAVKKMALELDLNEKQQLEIGMLKKEQFAQHEKSRLEQSVSIEKMSSEEQFALEIKKLDEQIAMKASMKNILTKDQMAKWELKKEHHAKRQHKREEPKEGKLKK